MARIHWLASAQPSQQQMIRYGVRASVFAASFSFERQPLTAETFASYANGHASLFMKKWLYAIRSESGRQFITQTEQAPKLFKSGRWLAEDGALKHQDNTQTKTLIPISGLGASPSFMGLPEIPFALMSELAKSRANGGTAVEEAVYGAFFPVTDKVFAFRVSAIEVGRYRGQIANVTTGFDEAAFLKVEWQKRSAFEFTWDPERALITKITLQIPTLGPIQIALIP